MGQVDKDGHRPPLKSSELYRPRLGSQPRSLAKSAMAELQAWREASLGDASPSEHTDCGQA